MNQRIADQAAMELRRRMAGEAVSPVQFLRHFWQKKPLLIRQAFASWEDPISQDELAGLACEEDVESRLVMERGGDKPWQVIPGPQKVSRLRRLPRSHWTLLVQGVDRQVPAVARLLQPFRFIPDWRVDDVMISFAPKAGTVGPHLDSYDVFLIQGQGHRRWQLDSKAPTALRPGMDLRLLKQFDATHDWVLEPGDMLYLPPNLAHYGVALDECLTYSIGFRSPSAMELLSITVDRLTQTGKAGDRYRDPGLTSAPHPGEIPSEALLSLRHLLERTLHDIPESEFADWVGRFLTEPKEASVPSARRLAAKGIQERLQKGDRLVRSPETRLGFIRQGRAVTLYVNGEPYAWEKALAPAAALLTRQREWTVNDLAPYLRDRSFQTFLTDVLASGALRLEHDGDLC